jgi:hypothetical protein
MVMLQYQCEQLDKTFRWWFFNGSLVPGLSTCLKDTTDYLKKMESMNPLPSGAILVSMDVTSLYTNISHNDGIEACREAWDQRAVKEPPTECLVQLLTLVLKHNNFTVIMWDVSV